MRLLVYTGVFGRYDRIFPPVQSLNNAHCVVVTDDASLQVRGCNTHVVKSGRFDSPRTANRYFKMLGHRDLGHYDASIYVDGNIRLLSDPAAAATSLLNCGAALGVFPHPRRNSVAEEVEACIQSGKVEETSSIRNEYRNYVTDGFPDNCGLIEATILIKNHSHPSLDGAMMLWHSLFNTYQTRDQISLPYVLWKTGLPYQYQDRTFREESPYFGIYPHLGDPSTPRAYTYLRARAFDSRIYKLCVDAWHAKWAIQRHFRRFMRSPQRAR